MYKVLWEEDFAFSSTAQLGRGQPFTANVYVRLRLVGLDGKARVSTLPTYLAVLIDNPV